MLLALRLLTLTAYAGLALSLARIDRGARLAAAATGRPWRWLTLLYGIIAVNLALLELRSAYLPFADGSALAFLFDPSVYHALYLLQTVVGASIPVVLLALLPRDPRWQRVSRVVFGMVVAIAIGAVAAGALTSWGVLLASTSVIYFVASGAHLAFWALLALGALERVGKHFAWFVAFETVFTLVMPVQEAFFRVVGSENAERIWFLNQLLQAVTAIAQMAVVWSLLRAQRETRGEAFAERPDPVVRVSI